ncbi:MAG: hypothetical protein CMF49_02970 [Legionellales bacterium]|mgnify:CR=1 FL=1|nr:hypothetical protein [Legionellales bacterium]|tara:strand:+ start:348 stop:899 length:552 start_codon:yes stop_codon:yes gene_type:complete
MYTETLENKDIHQKIKQMSLWIQGRLSLLDNSVVNRADFSELYKHFEADKANMLNILQKQNDYDSHSVCQSAQMNAEKCFVEVNNELKTSLEQLQASYQQVWQYLEDYNKKQGFKKNLIFVQHQENYSNEPRIIVPYSDLIGEFNIMNQDKNKERQAMPEDEVEQKKLEDEVKQRMSLTRLLN